MSTAAKESVLIMDLPVMPARALDSHKGDYGRVLVVAGSRGMSGAAILSASAAVRAGAGLVYLAVPQELLAIVAGANPCYLTTGLPQDSQGRIAGSAGELIKESSRTCDVLAIGPGLGQSGSLTALLASLLPQIGLPVVLDADGLNALNGQTDLFKRRTAPTILTPHPGEFARLLGCDIASVQQRRRDLAAQYAAEHGVVLVLKGYETVVTDGQRVYVNTTGNPGMATGGTGDVLTGVIAALIGQKLEPFRAAQLGVHVHGLAGDLARDAVGELSLNATDLLNHLPQAFRHH